MDKVSDELVERVARAAYEARHGCQWDSESEGLKESYRVDARAAIEALITPEFVLPLAEAMLRDLRSTGPYPDVFFYNDGTVELSAYRSTAQPTLLDAYRAEKGE